MSVNNKENALITNDANKKLIITNESNSNGAIKLSDNQDLNENSIAKTITNTMPGVARNTMSGTVTELNSHTMLQSADQCSDSEEDFDRTTWNLGAHKWIFNYKDVSATFRQNTECEKKQQHKLDRREKPCYHQRNMNLSLHITV